MEGVILHVWSSILHKTIAQLIRSTAGDVQASPKHRLVRVVLFLKSGEGAAAFTLQDQRAQI
jgi:hypothetical protein